MVQRSILNASVNPLLRIHLDDVSQKGVGLLLSLVDATKLLPNALDKVIRYLYSPYPGSEIPATRSVTLVLRPMDGVAYTSRLRIDNLHAEIHFSVEYIERFSKELFRCREEIIGVVTHEMVHCYQYNAFGTAPGGLIEGIADFVRFKAGLAPPHWKSPKEELGEKWDSGYQRTAFFLDWLEEKHGPGTVGKINDRMRTDRYEEKTFWEGIFGKGNSVETLWRDYRASLEDELSVTLPQDQQSGEREQEQAISEVRNPEQPKDDRDSNIIAKEFRS